MALKAVVTDVEQVDENLRDLYSERDGVWVLDVEASNGYELANTEGLKSALVKEREAARKAREQSRQSDENLEQEVVRLRGELKFRTLGEHARKAIEAAGGNVSLLEPHVRARLKLDEEDGVVGLDKAGNPFVDGEGRVRGPEAVVEELLENGDFAVAFKGSGASGGGSRETRSNSSPGSVRYVSNTPENVAKYADEISSGKVKLRKE